MELLSGFLVAGVVLVLNLDLSWGQLQADQPNVCQKTESLV